MQNEVDEPTSSAFLDVFYQELLKGNDVAAAVTSGRDFLGKVYNVAGPEIYKSNSFGSPVLFITTREPIQMLSNKLEVIRKRKLRKTRMLLKQWIRCARSVSMNIMKPRWMFASGRVALAS
jgi:hypothetical protein